MSSTNAMFPSSKVWVWSTFRRELIKIRQDGRPTSPSASSSTSRRLSTVSTPAVAPIVRKDEVIIRRAVEATFGRVDADEWVLTPDDPVEWSDCLKVALHLTTKNRLSTLLLSVLKLPLVQLLLRNLIQYFGILFDLSDEVSKIVAPAVANEVLLKKRWTEKLSDALNPLSVTYMRLLTGEQLERRHHMKRGRSFHSSKIRDEQLWEGIYGVGELLVWIVFRRRDQELVRQEFARLFRGPLGLSMISSLNSNSKCSQLRSIFASTTTTAVPSQYQETHEEKICKIKEEMKKTKKIVCNSLKSTSGLMSRTVPELSTARLVNNTTDSQLELNYVSKINATGGEVWGYQLGLLGSRKGDLNELLEPATTEEEDEMDFIED